MKKFFAVIAVLLIAAVALCIKFLPNMVEAYTTEQIVKATSASAVEVSLTSTPNFKIATGQIDKLHATADAGYIGDVAFKNLTLDGENISLDVMELLFPNKDLPPKDRQKKILKRANKIELRGIITDEELKNFIIAKNDKFENLQVTMTPDGAFASACTKFLGRTIDLEIAGIFIVNNGDIFFHVTNLNSNSILRRVNADTFMVDMKVLDSAKLPLNLQFDSVELREGEAVVTATTVK